MNYSIYRFTLDIHKTKSQVSIPVLFHDTGIKFYISLTDGGKPYFIEDGCRAVFSAKKSGGTQLFNDCIIEDNTRIRYDFTEQTTSSEGMMNCEIRLYGKDGELITTPAFVVIVDARVIYDSNVMDDNESTTLDNIVACEESRLAGERIRIEAENARVAAEAGRVLAEEARVIAEEARVVADSERAVEESARAVAEAERKVSEAARKEAFASMEGTWVAYSMYEDGTDYTWTWSEGQRYIGICNGKTIPQDKTGFVWSKFVDTGVYVGSGEMPSWCDLQIDPDGDVTEVVQTSGQSSTDVMSQKAMSDTFANALKGSKSGVAIFLDDVSPVEHELGVTVKGKNLFNTKELVANTTTNRGVTFEPLADGTIHVYGTNDGTGRARIDIPIVLPEGTYTLSGIPTGGSKTTYYWEFYGTESKQTYGYDFGSGITVKTSQAEKCNLQLSIAVDMTVDFIVYPMLEEGSTATAYAPYIEDISAVKVVECGKNLIPFPYNAYKDSTKGMYTDNGNGTITVNGTFASTPTCALSIFTLPSGTYTISSGVQDRSLGLSVRLIDIKTETYIAHSLDNAMMTFTVNEPTEVRCTIFGAKDKTYNNVTIYPMVEVGTTATEYALYTETKEYAVEASGVVKGIFSRGNDITLCTDTAGAFIECSYNKDANKAVNEIFTRIAALEAAVLK